MLENDAGFFGNDEKFIVLCAMIIEKIGKLLEKHERFLENNPVLLEKLRTIHEKRGRIEQ